MKRRSAGLRPVVDLAALDGREAALRLARSIGELARAEGELKRMQGYLEDYRPGPYPIPGTAMSPGRLENDRRFVARLAEVTAMQAQKVAAMRTRHAQAVADWQRAYRHDRALQGLFADLRRRELAALERQDAESADEAVARWLQLRSP